MICRIVFISFDNFHLALKTEVLVLLSGEGNYILPKWPEIWWCQNLLLFQTLMLYRSPFWECCFFYGTVLISDCFTIWLQNQITIKFTRSYVCPASWNSAFSGFWVLSVWRLKRVIYFFKSLFVWSFRVTSCCSPLFY